MSEVGRQEARIQALLGESLPEHLTERDIPVLSDLTHQEVTIRLEKRTFE